MFPAQAVFDRQATAFFASCSRLFVSLGLLGPELHDFLSRISFDMYCASHLGVRVFICFSFCAQCTHLSTCVQCHPSLLNLTRTPCTKATSVSGPLYWTRIITLPSSGATRGVK